MNKKTDKQQILCVDDEAKVLSGLKLQLRENYRVTTANSGLEGIDILKSKGPFATIISDMRMPEMDGATFLFNARKITPNSTRILLTGQSDIESAMAAINQGQIFRFVMKPCPKEDLLNIIKDAVEQYRLLNIEKELLEKTLQSSIKVLTEILSMVNPLAFSHSNRISRYVKFMADKAGLKTKWQYNIAAMLSQVGHITVPADTLAKLEANQNITSEEMKLLESASDIAYELIKKIPRLQVSAEIIKIHNRAYSDFPQVPIAEAEALHIGAQMLKIAQDFEYKKLPDTTSASILADMQDHPGLYNPELLSLLKDMQNEKQEQIRKTIAVKDLSTNMVIDQDIKSSNGALLMSKGQDVTDAVRLQLQQVEKNGNLTDEVIRVIEYL